MNRFMTEDGFQLMFLYQGKYFTLEQLINLIKEEGIL